MDVRAQTFTLEGVAASLLVLIAVYAIFQSTVVISPAWSDYARVQLKQLGYDILLALDNPNGGNSSLQGMIENCSLINGQHVAPREFSSNFSRILTNLSAFGRLEIVWINGSEIETFVISGFDKEPTPDAVRVSRFVVVPDLNSTCFNLSNPETKVVEVRLTLWRI
ncbi:MAG: hypothetical protein ABWW66_03840 [Archaeoglobaceae archaeon]